MKWIRCLAPVLVLTACASRSAGPPPRVDVSSLATNRLVVEIDDVRKISVRENGAVVFDKRVVARIDDRGKVSDTRGQLLAWLYDDNVRLRGGVVVQIRTGPKGELFLSRSAQEKASLVVATAQVSPDGRIVAAPGRVPTMRLEGDKSAKSRRIAVLLLFMLDNDMFGSPPAADDAP